MAADVSFVYLISNTGDNEDEKEAVSPVTRDLLGGCSKESGLDANLPSPWQKRTSDIVSRGNFQQRNAPIAILESNTVHDLNFPPPASLSSPSDLRSFTAGNLDLSLNLPAASRTIQNESVCTLEKVRFALERAARYRKRPESTPSPASSSGRSGDSVGPDPEDSSSGVSMVAAGCPNCLLYVLISGRNPKCPRCDAVVPLPSASPTNSAAKKISTLLPRSKSISI